MDYIIGRISIFEMDPAKALGPGIAVKASGGQINSDPRGGGIVEADPAGVFAPGIAGKTAVAVVIDAPVVGVGIRVRSAAIGAQLHPAGRFRPGETGEMGTVDRDPAIFGMKIQPAAGLAPGIFVGGADVA